MKLLDKVLEANRKFVASYQPQSLTARPKEKLAIVTCMDTRLVDFLEPAMGLGRGDAKLIKNAGNTITEGSDEVLRSVLVAIYELGAEEVMVIGHTRCGMAHAKVEELVEHMVHRGIKKELLEGIDLKKWLGLFSSEEENVIRVVGELKKSPLIPAGLPIHGLIIDIDTGEMRVLVDGYQS
ncbi:MAG: carbonic anhydrase [Syntrophomonadaceae bacterium]|nr:carbonic anhydrase [Syntrophomonadaceae bacterium]